MIIRMISTGRPPLVKARKPVNWQNSSLLCITRVVFLGPMFVLDTPHNETVVD